MECRSGCGACCIAPSITTPIPDMPAGKPADVRCVQLDENNLCRLFGRNGRPAVCASFTPQQDVCGEDREEALQLLKQLERLTA